MGNPADSWHTQSLTLTHTPPHSALSLLLLLPLSSLPSHRGEGNCEYLHTVLYSQDPDPSPLASGKFTQHLFPLRRIRSNWHPRCSVHSTIPTSIHCYPAASPLCLHSGPVATPIYGPLVRNVAPRTVENPATTTAAAASSVLERERHDTCT